METMTINQMMRISVAMPILFGLSVLVVGQALERFYVFWVSRRMPAGLWEKLKARLREGDRAGALALAGGSSNPMAQAFESMLCAGDAGTERLIETFQLYRQRLQMDLSRKVGLFGTASFVSPLIGLMGTVLGIMRAFHDLSAAGAGGPAVVAAGISEALVATAMGIAVAVVSAILYNYFTLSARHRLALADLWVFELSRILAENPSGLAQDKPPPGPGLLTL
jgi:biopolymer transport protein ExbB